MSCNCHPTAVAPQVPEVLPVIGECDQHACDRPPDCSEPSSVHGSPVTKCEDSNAIRSSASCGTTLPNSWADAIGSDDKLTLLARVGRKLARFTGSGFIQIVKGEARLVNSIRLKLSTLWHQWWKPPGINQSPVLGEPLDFDFLATADSQGDLHGIAGRTDEKSIPVYDPETKKWRNTGVSNVPTCKRGHLPAAPAIELTGYAPIAMSDDADIVRCLSRLAGSGLIVVTEVPAPAEGCDCEGCEPLPGKAYVASFLANPSGEGPFTLKFSAADGHYWEADD